jgi:hypothetical protein
MTAVLPRILRAVRLAALALPLLVVTPAFAGYGSITPASKLVPETAGGWKMALTVKLPKAPDPAYQTYRFLFTPQVLYETYMDDTKPGEQTRDLPQAKDVKPMVESLEVGFSDARNQVWDTTKFDFVIKRDRGFEAGTYKIEVRDTNDKTIGSPFVVKLDGKNPMVDRRAMIMTGGKKKEAPAVKKDEPSSAPAAPAETSTSAPSADGAPASDAPSAPPPPVKKGCAVSAVLPADGSSPVAYLLTFGLVGLAAARRRSAFVSRLARCAAVLPRQLAEHGSPGNLPKSGGPWHGLVRVCPPLVDDAPRRGRARSRILDHGRAPLRRLPRRGLAGGRRDGPQLALVPMARRRRHVAGRGASRRANPGHTVGTVDGVRVANAGRPSSFPRCDGVSRCRGRGRSAGRLAGAATDRGGWRIATRSARARAARVAHVHAVADDAGRSDGRRR